MKEGGTRLETVTVAERLATATPRLDWERDLKREMERTLASGKQLNKKPDAAQKDSYVKAGLALAHLSAALNCSRKDLNTFLNVKSFQIKYFFSSSN